MPNPTEESERLRFEFKKQCCIEDTPTGEFSEMYEHMLFHDDGGWNFHKGEIDYMPPEEMSLVDWPVLRQYTQRFLGEDGETPEGTIDDRKKAMQYCKNFIKEKYNDDLGIPDPETLPWMELEESAIEYTTESTRS